MEIVVALESELQKRIADVPERSENMEFVITAQNGGNASRHLLATNTKKKIIKEAERARWPFEILFFLSFSAEIIS